MQLTRPLPVARCAIALLLSLGLRGTAGEPTRSPAGLRFGQLRVDKVLFLGNSITLHGPAESIGWSGNWGMAASTAEKDSVHLLTARFKDAAQGEPQVMVKNVADFERQYATYDVTAGLPDAIDFQADVIIIAIGENVPALSTPEDKNAYQNAFVKLLSALRHDPQQVVFVRSTFWTEPVRNECMAAACRQTGDVFIDLSGLDQDEGNFARSERKFAHAGVAAHPGDKGMQAIADRIWRAIEQRASGENWPEFRGPTGDGHSAARGLPLTWRESENVVWKTPVHDYGWSSPVVWQDQVWVTTATADGKQLFAVCVSRDSGQLLHDVKVFDVEKPEHVASVNSYASPTPAIEAGRVYVHYGTYGTACLDTQSGQVLWTRRDLNCDHHEGPGSSPVLFEDLLIVHVDGRDVQYVIALDKATGQTVWKTNRSIDYSQFSDNMRKAFCTPTVIDVGARKELISPGAKAVMGYNPTTGEELWKVRYNGWSMVPRPLFGHGLVYVVNDFDRPELWAIRPGGEGDVTDSHVVWQIGQGVPAQPSLLLVDDLLYAVSDLGVAVCIAAQTGEIVWKNRIGGNFAASPMCVDGRIYFFSQDGTTTVLAPGPEYKVLAVNQLEGEMKASPAIAGRDFFLRTRTHLYCLRQQGDDVPRLPPAETPEQQEARLQWWREARFGMFIHWGPSSVSGKEISWSRVGHPFDHPGNESLPPEVYDNLYKQFNPVKFDADAWMQLAQAAGMKYVVFITKHHDGFSMWPTQLRSEYSITATPFGRDICREIADAANKHGLKLGWYYSTRDWTHPDYLVGDNRKYDEFYQGQVRELLSNYGRVDLMWFDHVAGNWRDYRFRELYEMMFRLQPGILVNDRAARFIRGTEDQPAPELAALVKGDFDTPEQRIGNFQRDRPWESCVTMTHCVDGGGWSYRPDGRTRSFDECLQMLVQSATGDGNLLLNVGPLPTGEIAADQQDVLRQMGQWLGKYGESIYATRGGPFRNGPWGGSTCRGKTVYLHVLQWTGDSLQLPPLRAKILSAVSLTGGEPVLNQSPGGLNIGLPAVQQATPDTVIRLELDAPADQ